MVIVESTLRCSLDFPRNSPMLFKTGAGCGGLRTKCYFTTNTMIQYMNIIGQYEGRNPTQNKNISLLTEGAL